MNKIYEAKYSKVKKVIGNLAVGDLRSVKVPGSDSIKLILRNSKKMVTIQHMSMDAYWQDLRNQGLPEEMINELQGRMAVEDAIQQLEASLA